ncbi:MAG TPA: hypothetical protein VLT17_04510 [Gemmatimonadales bacterium]|jgi:hypothetical protein|nr:hypothetical protein [Gemmatimonadales bacterium]
MSAPLLRPNTRLLFGCLIVAGATPLVAQQSTTVGGYGEVHYTNSDSTNSPGSIDLKRFVFYLAHSFNDRISFRSEVEIEDAKVEGGEDGGEVSVEQAYLDYRFGEPATLRAGLVLVPVGIVNEVHEPPTFNGVDRGLYSDVVIPTTWRELGLGVAGSIPGVQGLVYRAYLVNGLKAEGFTGAEGIREGRQEGQNASFANAALAGRVEWSRPGLKVGISGYYGGSANGVPGLGSGAFAAPVFIGAIDGRYEIGAFQFRGEAATESIRDAAAINAFYGNGVGSRIAGWYLEAAWNALHLLARNSSQRLVAFARYEQDDTHASVPSGTPRNPAFDRSVATIGLTWKPISQVAFKGDYRFRRNTAQFQEDNVLSLGIGWMF